MDKSRFGRKDRLIKEKRHDTYQVQKKHPEPTVCTECRAMFHSGRWTWDEAPEYAYTTVCPACRRKADNYPAGHLEIRGTFMNKHREELLNMIQNIEKQEKMAHPLERIMSITDKEDHSLITTTGVHLSRRLGEALKHAYQGELDFTYGDAEKSIRLTWNR